MQTLSGLFGLIYLGCVIAIILFLLRSLSRLVSAHERVAGSLEAIARKLRDDARP